MHRHPRLPAGFVAVAALALVACGGAGDTDATEQSDDTEQSNDTEHSNDTEQSDDKEASVVVATFNFQPDPLVVAAGTTITFVNEDAIDHTVTAGTREQPTPQVFDGQLAEQGATFVLTLGEPGSYEYFCRIHPGPGMTASITVE